MPLEYLLVKLSLLVWALTGGRMPLDALALPAGLLPAVPSRLLELLFIERPRSSGRSRSKGSERNLLRRVANDSTETRLSRPYTVLGARVESLMDWPLERLMSAT
jgi:hypothetical protein